MACAAPIRLESVSNQGQEEAKESRLRPQVEPRHDEVEHAAALVRRCVAGDSTAWEEIVELHHRRIYNICYRFTGRGEDAEDLTQEVFIKIYKTLKTYDSGRGAFATWVATMTRNLLVDHFRKSKQERMTDSLDASASPEEDGPTLHDRLADAGSGPQEHIEQTEKQRLIHQALQKLSPELREAVILRDLQDMDYREIAQILRVPEGTVKSRINRGRTELGRLLSRIYRQVQ
ncbi:MAG: RNA polymerase sigma factor [Acidobacteriales bacterium]|nr:RNA polymerase sigma factor [Terriglobales bacterium]